MRKSAECPKFVMVLAVSLAYPSEEEGDNFLVHIISPCLPSRIGRGVGVGTLWSYPPQDRPNPDLTNRGFQIKII